MDYILELEAAEPGPQESPCFCPNSWSHWWEYFLHNQRVQCSSCFSCSRETAHHRLNIPWYL